MKHSTEILKEIQEERAKITNASAENLKRFFKASASDAKLIDIKKYEKLKNERDAETKENTRHELIIQILSDNEKQAFFAENIAKICDIWNKYTGKSHGEKTSEKIRAELRETVGEPVRIMTQYNTAHIFIYRQCADNIECTCTKYGVTHTDANNKITRLSPDDFKVMNCGEYVENIPEHIEKLLDAYLAAQEAEQAYKKAIEQYNNLTRGRMEQANTRDGIKNWII